MNLNTARIYLETTLNWTIYPFIFHPTGFPSPLPMHDPMPTVNTAELLHPGHVLEELPQGHQLLKTKAAPFTPSCLTLTAPANMPNPSPEQLPRLTPTSPTTTGTMHQRILSIMPTNTLRMAALLVLHQPVREGGVCLDGMDLEHAVEEVAARVVQRTIKAACEKDQREGHPLATMSNASSIAWAACQWASVEGVGANRAKWLAQRDAWDAVCNAH